ncbi:hypothetical protein CHS0354_043045 [Potamilus streckersoni]|uniref:Uncharacterized protein n=1 Tax=Potamilus streckersoni TaxID=2493646 RepID=A0AAE0SCX4_9BIVA|nr:hypothetical protein CHS0354_043045 [Potamilus streckersoni]
MSESNGMEIIRRGSTGAIVSMTNPKNPLPVNTDSSTDKISQHYPVRTYLESSRTSLGKKESRLPHEDAITQHGVLRSTPSKPAVSNGTNIPVRTLNGRVIQKLARFGDFI